ncbi:MAG: hypothetical protein ABW221_17245 [Vicinamibacteria bacterium]
MTNKTTNDATTRREMLKKASYVVPAVLTLAVKPSFATAASGSGGGNDPGAHKVRLSNSQGQGPKTKAESK